jgi:hypothetical protein
MAVNFSSSRDGQPARVTAPMGGRIAISETAQTETRTRIHVAALQSARGLLPEARINQIVDDVWRGMTPQERLTADANPGAWMARVESEVRQAQATKPLNASAATPAELAAQRASMGLAGQFAGVAMRGMRASDAEASSGGGSSRVTSETYARGLSGLSESSRQMFGKIGITGSDFLGLEQRFGHEAATLATQQVYDMGMRGKRNVEDAATFPALAAALHTGDIASARAQAEAESDPDKKKRMLQFIERRVEAARGQVNQATKDMPKEEAEQVKKTFEGYHRDPKNEERKKEYDALKEKYKDNPAMMRGLGKAEKEAGQITKANAAQQKENKQTEQKATAKEDKAAEIKTRNKAKAASIAAQL